MIRKVFSILILMSTINSFGQTSIEELIKSGLKQEANKNYEEAINYFNKALAIDSLYIPGYINRGNTYYDMGDYPKAMADVTKALKIDSNFAIGYNNRGLIYKSQKKYSEAISDFDKAISLDKTYYMAYVNKIRALLLSNKNTEAQTTITNLKKELPNKPESYLVGFVYCTLVNDISGAINELNTAVATDPISEKALSERAEYFDELDDNKRAVSDYTKLIALNPNEAKYYYGRSSANYDMKNYDEVITDCKKAVDLDDNYYNAYAMLGDVYDTYGQKEKSLANYEKAIRIRPNFEYAYIELNKVYFAQKEYAKCIEVLNRLLDKNPNTISGLEYRASAKAYLKNNKGSIEDYHTLIARNPNNYFYYYNIAMVEKDNKDNVSACENMKKAKKLNKIQSSEDYLVTHQFIMENCRSSVNPKILKVNDLHQEASNLYEEHKIDLVIKKYDEMIKIIPDSSSLYYNRGKMKRELEKHEDAILDYKKAVQFDKKNAIAWVAMGVSYINLSQTDNGIKAFQEAMKADENNAMAIYNLGFIYVEKKEYEKAIQYLELTVQKDPNYIKAYFQLGEVYLLKGNKEKACYNFKRAELLGNTTARIKILSECQ